MTAFRRALPLLAAMTAASLATSALAASDQEFLHKAMEGDNSEITLGHMAEQKGASDGVRQFGATLVADHTKAREMALPVAKQHGVAATQQLQPEARAEEQKLKGLSGAAFDREFARYMVQDHKKDISDFEKQVAHGDASTKALAQQTLPDLRKHLAMAEKLSSAH